MRRLKLAASGLLLSTSIASAGNVYVPLIIDETAGFDRNGSLVTAGVPLPRGRVREVAWLRILDSTGTAIPAQFEVQMRWPDGSLEWVLASFLASVPAGGTARYALTSDPLTPQPAPASPLSLEIVGGNYFMTGATGIWSGLPRPFSEMYDDRGNDVLSAQRSDLVATIAGVPYRMSFNAPPNAIIERNGPISPVLRIEGTLYSASGQPSPITYVMRLHFLSSGAVRVMLTILNPQAARHVNNVWDLGSPGSIAIEDLTLSLFHAPGSYTWRAWSDSPTPQRGTLNPANPISLYQESSGGARWNWPTHVDASNNVPMTLRGWELRDAGGALDFGLRADGLLDVESTDPGGSGIAVATRWFWQEFPKALRAGASGPSSIDVSLWPLEFPIAHELQGGEEKTFEILAWPHRSGASDSVLLSVMNDLRHPLRARPDADEAARTRALGRFGPRDPLAFPHWENTVEFIAYDKGVRSFFTQREEIDEYGWRNFGEAFADHETDCGTQCWDSPVSHDNNQYDYIAAAQLFWIRNGGQPWADLGEQGARHLADIDVYHSDLDTPAYNHGMFWHTTHDTNAFTSTHRTYSALMSSACTPYLSGGPALGHLYTEGLQLHGLLTGDRHAFDVLDELDDYMMTRYALDAPAPGSGYETRAWANALRAAVASFRRTGDPALYAFARRLVLDSDARVNPAMDGRTFQDSMLMVSLSRFLDLKSDQGLLADADADVARQSLLNLAARVRANYTPQQDTLDFRYSEGLWGAHVAAPLSDPDEPAWAQLGRDYFIAGENNAWFDTYITCKGLAHVATNGHAHGYFERGRVPEEAVNLRVTKSGRDLVLACDAVARDVDGKPIVVGEYRVHRSPAVPTRFTDFVASSAPSSPIRLTSEIGMGPRLVFYEMRAAAAAGREGY